MIPAILSCAYVIYLYVLLNKDVKSTTPSDASLIQASDPMPGLIDRLNRLQKRLDAIGVIDTKGGKS